MRFVLLAVSNRQPGWVTAGVEEYAGRLKGASTIQLVRVPLGSRSKGQDIARARKDEGERLLSRIPDRALVVALDVQGRSLSTETLSEQIRRWSETHRDCWLMIGGPDGLAGECLERADFRWSLSPLTFPHGLAQIVVAEALYRAQALNHGHPYHRG